MKMILVVDDDAAFREVLSHVLETNGFQTAMASNGAAALRIIESQKPDLVLLDLNMPGTDGFHVLARLRDTAAFAKIPVIVLTIASERESVVRAAQGGAVEYLIKSSFTVEDLLDRIRKRTEHSPEPVAAGDPGSAEAAQPAES